MTDTSDHQQRLKQRQDAGTRVEERMLQMLMGFEPTCELKVRDVQFIARVARQHAFDEFSKSEAP